MNSQVIFEISLEGTSGLWRVRFMEMKGFLMPKRRCGCFRPPQKLTQMFDLDPRPSKPNQLICCLNYTINQSLVTFSSLICKILC